MIYPHATLLVNYVSIQLFLGDITEQEVDLIVTPMSSGSAKNNGTTVQRDGVNGAIHGAAGPEVANELVHILAANGPCSVGNAVITSAGKLKAKHIVHVLGPSFRDGDETAAARLLALAYENSLKLASDAKAYVIAFPSISTGSKGYPVEQAADIALSTIVNYSRRSSHFNQVRFVLFDAKTLDAYERTMKTFRNSDLSWIPPTREQIMRVLEFLPIFEASQFTSVTNSNWKTEDPVPHYSEPVESFFKALWSENLIYVPSEKEGGFLGRLDQVQKLPLDQRNIHDICLTLTNIQQSEKFCYGAWEAAFQYGSIVAILKRLEQIVASEN